MSPLKNPLGPMSPEQRSFQTIVPWTNVSIPIYCGVQHQARFISCSRPKIILYLCYNARVWQPLYSYIITLSHNCQRHLAPAIHNNFLHSQSFYYYRVTQLEVGLLTGGVRFQNKYRTSFFMIQESTRQRAQDQSRYCDRLP